MSPKEVEVELRIFIKDCDIKMPEDAIQSISRILSARIRKSMSEYESRHGTPVPEDYLDYYQVVSTLRKWMAEGDKE